MGIFAALLPILGGIIDKVIPDKQAAQKAKNELMQAEVKNQIEIASKQLEVNAEEAKNPNIFVAGWRPAVGWICVIALAWRFILFPICITILPIMGYDISIIPAFGTENLMTILLGMLGLGSLRTFEKFKGISK